MIIDKVTRVRKEVDGEVWVNGEGKFTHSMSKDEVFIDSKEALEYAETDDDCDIEEFREDFEETLRYAECDAEISSNDAEIVEYSIDECPEHLLNEVLSNNKEYEVKEMKYEIDGVKSTKKVLVEKELEVA